MFLGGVERGVIGPCDDEILAIELSLVGDVSVREALDCRDLIDIDLVILRFLPPVFADRVRFFMVLSDIFLEAYSFCLLPCGNQSCIYLC